VRDLREGQKGILVLDSGDLLFKKYVNLVPENERGGMGEKAHLMIESFNLMGYDAVGIGDDDLTLGKEFLLEISKKANFPFLSSNLFDEASGKNLFQLSLIKQVHGLRVGIFSLLSPDAFTNSSDPRRKGLNIRPPIEVANAMVKELKPKADLVILLSHLGYAKDLELAQSVQGINMIVGGHTGINLVYPLLIKNTIILQTASRGMFAARLELLFHNDEPVFYNSATKVSLENNLKNLNQRLNAQGTPEAEKAQLEKAKEETERTLNQIQNKNQFTNHIVALQEQMKDDPDIKKLIEAYKTKTLTPVNPVPPK
jgi:2',3'-cyclic-nucleotide 2'-phosphodiesterase (5'-nucleotidase family)